MGNKQKPSSAPEREIDRHQSLEFRRVHSADKEELFVIVQETSGDILLASLRNPSFDENHLMSLLKRRGLPEQIFTSLYAGKILLDNYPVKFAVAAHPDTPAHIATTILQSLYMFDLLKICTMPGVTPDTRLGAERAIIQRIPAQPLGNKVTLARRGTAAIVEALLRDGQSPVVEACLANPNLKEGMVHQFLASSASNAETISMVGRSTRWQGRPNIRLAILKNPRTPAIWFTLFLPGLPRTAVRELLSVPRLTAAQKELIRQALDGKRCTP